MTESPTLKPTQKQMLLALIAKQGWDEATFAAVARTPLDALTQAQARQWITKLTKDTKGKPTPAPGDPVVSVTPRKQARLTPTSDVSDLPPESSATSAPPAGSAPSEVDFIQARNVILAQLDPMGMTAPATIDQILRQVGIEIGIRAVGLARQTMQSHSGEHRLTALEQWVVCCRQIQARTKTPINR